MTTMNPAEFACTREALGLSHRWVSEWMGVNEKSVRDWESGRTDIPDWAAEAIDELSLMTTAEMRRRLTDPKVLDRGHVWITYRTDADYREGSLGQVAYAPKPLIPDGHGEAKHFPASWNRALVSTCRAEVGGRVTYYVPKNERS